MNNENIVPLTIKELLSENKYRIPIYQRNYDWGEKETLQLIEDIADYAALNGNSKYYIGSVVVFIRHNNGEEYFETIDGQQRLTTLSILVATLKNMDCAKNDVTWYTKTNLSYDHRTESDEALIGLMDNKLSRNTSAENIVEVYKIIQKNLLNILKDKDITINSFVQYLLSNVIILRIPVPHDTELNHYFEIMNSRGEQLEKHEVLKATLMSYLEEDKDTICLFNDIWEACSDMSTYVQMKFKPKMRTALFTNEWNILQFSDYESVLDTYKSINEAYEDNSEDEYICRSLTQLFEDAKNNVKYELPDSDNDAEGANDRFGSIINFPNFLLQVLKIMYQGDEDYNKETDANIKLDDKRLIEIFHLVLNKSIDKRKFIKRFIMSLLTIRVLFDYYVIKRENYNGREGWSIKMPKKYDKSNVSYIGTFTNDDAEDDTSKDIRMLEAMFHVSAPTQIYKHWLNATLNYLFTTYNSSQDGIISATDFRSILYLLACAYMKDRYLCDTKIDFEEIIYHNDLKSINNQLNWSLIDNGCSVENFVFNFYDYITWKQNPSKFAKFEFTYRTSVEHFYPQTPQTGHEELTQETGLNDFGNLCLISRGMNSKFSNNMPIAKVENFGREEALNELSIKLIEMMEVVRDTGKWCTPEIREFESKARKRIEDALK